MWSLEELIELRTALETKEDKLIEAWRQTGNRVIYSHVLSIRSQLSAINYDIGLIKADEAFKRYKEKIEKIRTEG